MSDRCMLKESTGIVASCDAGQCPYWRALGHLGITEQEAGCAIARFGLLDGAGDEVVEWLFSVKSRLEAQEASSHKALA
ncbi:MAG: hypothetical protein Q7V14_06595 [Coriobacteriia bacterium]|nr:hypothetical protein [Coriobacteriia bacterium]